MRPTKILAAGLILLLCGSSIAQLQDSTRVAGAAGPQLVESVVSLIRESCVFPNDRLLLRRLAFVATDDGQDPLTYRLGFDGGIWALSRAEFQRTQNDASLQTYYADISCRFGIDWSQVRWSDLRKPLYSGLGAALLLAHSFGEHVPLTAATQAAWYQGTRFPSGPSVAANFTAMAQQLDTVCTSSNLDLAFLVDSSASLNPLDFKAALTWAADVLDPFNVAMDSVRVAFVTFSTGYNTTFDFNDLDRKADVQNAIRGARYHPGSTDTDLVLAFAATKLFTPAYGARLASAKVAVLVTDGKATHSSDAIVQAQQLRDQGVIVFVIGVGSAVDERELRSLASQPYCTHVQRLHDYGDLGTLQVTDTATVL